MSRRADIIVVGTGLAGVCSALWLTKERRVLLLDGAPMRASAIAAGLVNPFAGMRARPVWHAIQALRDFERMLGHASATQHFNPSGILRPASTSQQAIHYESAAERHPRHCTWLLPGEAAERFPAIAAAHGLLVTRGGVVDIGKLLNTALSTLEASACDVRRNATIRSWGEMSDEAFVVLDSGERLHAKTLVLALGYGFRRFARLRELNLHCVKGQVVQTTIPDGVRLQRPVCGHGYVVPIADRLILGATYERGFAQTKPTESATRAIIELTSRMIPEVKHCHVVNEAAAVRVGVPGTRLPMVGPIGRRTWVFTGLGSKGLLFASHIARNLPRFLANPALIPQKIRVHRSPR